MTKLKLVAFSKKIPKKFKWINWFILLPILFWPLVFFSTIFFFDDPSANPTLVWTLFFGVNFYPLYLIVIYELNARFYIKTKTGAYILPLLMIGSLLFLVGREYISNKKFDSERKIENQKRKDEGYIGTCDSYKIKNNIVSYKDSIINTTDPNYFELINCHYAKDNKQVYKGNEPIIGSDPETFQIINPKWQKDENHYYFFGEALNYLDYNTFEILDINYSRDKNHVYYYQRILPNADPLTFKINAMTHYATDKNYTFFRGKIVTK